MSNTLEERVAKEIIDLIAQRSSVGVRPKLNEVITILSTLNTGEGERDD